MGKPHLFQRLFSIGRAGGHKRKGGKRHGDREASKRTAPKPNEKVPAGEVQAAHGVGRRGRVQEQVDAKVGGGGGGRSGLRTSLRRRPSRSGIGIQ